MGIKARKTALVGHAAPAAQPPRNHPSAHKRGRDMRIAVLEDDQHWRRQLVLLLERYLQQQGGGSVEPYAQADALLAAHRPGLFDLLILDCVLEGDRRTGVDVLLELRRRGDTAPAMLVTSSPDYAIAGYAADVRAYLLKPVTFGRLSAELDRLGICRQPAPQPAVRVRGVGDVAADAVSCVRAEGHYVVFRQADGSEERYRAPFGQVEEDLLACPQFFHTARGYLANLDYVERLDGTDLVFFGGARVPVSRRLVSATREALAERGFARLRGQE